MMAQEDELQNVVAGLKAIFEGHNIPSDYHEDGIGLTHLHWMCDELLAEMHADEPDSLKDLLKQHRWLGYIQHGLIQAGLTTLRDERARCRADFVGSRSLVTLNTGPVTSLDLDAANKIPCPMKFVVLAGIGYNVSIIDRQVIFEERSPIYGGHTRFVLERPVDINNTGGTWRLVEISDSCGSVSMEHLVQAYAWCCEQFGGNFDPYKAELKL